MRRVLRVAVATAGIVLILASVGGPAAVASYNHAAKVALKYGETAQMSAWLPLTTDGMLVAALVVMYARRWRDEPVGRWPWVAFLSGTVATLAANLAAADLTTATSVGEIAGRLAVAVWPPIAFALTLELVALMLPFLRATDVDTPAWPVTWRIGIPVHPYHPPVPEPDQTDRTDVVPDGRAWLDSAPWSGLGPAPRDVREYSAIDTRRGPVREVIDPPGPDRPRNGKAVPLVLDRRRPDRTADRVKRTAGDDTVRAWIADHRTRTGSLPSGRAVRTAHGIGPARANRLLGEFTGPDRTGPESTP